MGVALLRDAKRQADSGGIGEVVMGWRKGRFEGILFLGVMGYGEETEK